MTLTEKIQAIQIECLENEKEIIHCFYNQTKNNVKRIQYLNVVNLKLQVEIRELKQQRYKDLQRKKQANLHYQSISTNPQLYWVYSNILNNK